MIDLDLVAKIYFVTSDLRFIFLTFQGVRFLKFVQLNLAYISSQVFVPQDLKTLDCGLDGQQYQNKSKYDTQNYRREHQIEKDPDE